MAANLLKTTLLCAATVISLAATVATANADTFSTYDNVVTTPQGFLATSDNNLGGTADGGLVLQLSPQITFRSAVGLHASQSSIPRYVPLMFILARRLVAAALAIRPPVVRGTMQTFYLRIRELRATVSAAVVTATLTRHGLSLLRPGAQAGAHPRTGLNDFRCLESVNIELLLLSH